MLNTRKKFFELPDANRGPLKIAGSILFVIFGTTGLLLSIWVIDEYIVLPLIKGNKNLSVDSFYSLLFLCMSTLFFYLAYRLRKSAFINEKNEFLGETI
ncbi:hypothetical protein [Chitinophaga silvatica]|nr:hypothetical protein [Chitinophaga silvatica]